MRLFVDNLTNVDFSYLHPERGLLGETWLASTELIGVLDEQGMVCDFGIVKKTLRNWLDEEVDHRLLVPRHSPNLTLSQQGSELDIEWRFGDQLQHTLKCRSPQSAIALIDAEEITPASVSQWSIQQLLPLLPETLDDLLLDFNTENITGSFYHYSHGLKKHAGNCQRIAHGHRSKIGISRNGKTDSELEALWAKRFADIYIGTREDITDQDDHHIHFAYQTNQGRFALQIPIHCCYLIDTDSTVEWIADHLAQQLKATDAQASFTVKAYEGMGKGAIVSI
ncbi:MAG: 6-carboxytetrahydropterin synthase [Candidatus Pelagadaptatus aseana]|uniref:6-carboxytetrahydropterin synthase n=1 Tax=Candidatus Pelagadaptatus aseana TaxID=3120508 RepID=UPI0039B16E8C